MAVDFAVTQVVDGNWGIHSIIPKKPFGLPTVGPGVVKAATSVAGADAKDAAAATVASAGSMAGIKTLALGSLALAAIVLV